MGMNIYCLQDIEKKENFKIGKKGNRKKNLHLLKFKKPQKMENRAGGGTIFRIYIIKEKKFF
jgi:hypothetical protein